MVRQLVRRAGLRRSHLQSARTHLERRLVPALPRRPRARSGGRILCYHSVGSSEWGYNDVAPDRFRQQLELAVVRGYRFVDARAIADGGGASMDLAVTFDDGARSVLENAAPALAELGIPWTLFVVSDFASGRHPVHPGSYLDWAELRELADAGVAVGSHTVDHPNLGHLDREHVWAELWNSRQAIEHELGREIDMFAIPYGTSRDWTPLCRELAMHAGYRIVYAQSEDRRAKDTVPRTFMTSFDTPRTFTAALSGAFDTWEEWL